MNSDAFNRRNFIGVTAGAAGMLLLPKLTFSQATSNPTAAAPPVSQQAAATPKPRPDPLKPELVKEFVVAAHVDLDKTKAMLSATPSLLNATWDWGGGDFEMAIGGAGHMGRPDIANFLISQGGRFDIFVAAMLGRVEIVKVALNLNPNLAESKGPHGIPLMVHARKGGDAAAEVVRFLESFRAI